MTTLFWRKLPTRRTRINRCGLCNTHWPAMFDVPNNVWEHYVSSDWRDHMVCICCWRDLINAVDGGAYQDAYGIPLPLWSPTWRIRHEIEPERLCPIEPDRLEYFTIQSDDWAMTASSPSLPISATMLPSHRSGTQ